MHHGGKTTHLAELMKNTGEIEAWDLHVNRVKLVEENAKRLGSLTITTKQKDALQYEEKYKEKFDKILLDVPCMGLGVLKRKPDIKWKKTKEELEDIVKVQKQILEVCSKYLKSGGELVYSTCSILKEENENIVKEFIKEKEKQRKEFIKEKIIKISKEKIRCMIPNKSSIYKPKQEKNTNKEFNILEQKTILPNQNTDGFYMCKLKKW